MKNRKLSLGRKTLRSIEFQVTTILQSLHVGAIEIRKIRPHRTDIGNHVWITYRTSIDPELLLRRNFALQKIGECCDVWLDSPSDESGKSSTPMPPEFGQTSGQYARMIPHSI